MGAFEDLAKAKTLRDQAAADTDIGVRAKKPAGGKPLPATPTKATAKYDSETQAEYRARMKALGYEAD